MELTPEQLAIINNCDTTNLYINACPGSGKSTILAQICKTLLLKDKNYKILLVTFTNAAARSIINKCSDLDTSRILGGTFHSIAYKSLKQVGVTANICDEHKKRLIIKSIFKCRKDRDKFEEIYEQISNGKSRYPEQQSYEICKYNKELQRYNLIDFDDIILRFIKQQELSTQLKGSTHVLVDEMQDTSHPQFEMLKKVISSTNSRVIGVADDDQCIYEWRGARPDNVRDFITQCSCLTLNMGTNFRSNATIVRHSTELIKHNKNRLAKELRSYTTKTGPIATYKCQNPFDEIDYIVAKCTQNQGAHIAILYRNRTFKYHLEYKLRQANLKYKVNDFLDITDRSAVRTVIACLKIAADCYDYFDIEQAAKALRGLGNVTLTKLKHELENKDNTVRSVITEWLKDKKLKGRLKSITNLQNSFKEALDLPLSTLVTRVQLEFIPSYDYQAQMKELMLDITKLYKTCTVDILELANELGLDTKDENEDKDAKIELSTVHGAKGLEYDVVIVPFTQMYLEPAPGRLVDEEAERRLFYVAITRAKEKLYLCYSGPQPQFIKEMKI